jgi:glutamate N-acetyltransferase/amino-acid N-acetyltransferase
MYKIEQIDSGVVAPSGFFADGVSAGLKSDNQLDLGFIRSEKPSTIGAVFTTNRMTASPIKKFRKDGVVETDFILVNSKNANAMTGEAGVSDIEDIFGELESSYKLHNPVMSSTGVIGVRLPKDKIIAGAKSFNLNSRNSDSFSRAIMTTDSYPKEIAFRVTLKSGESFSIGGVAKGAGMINPSMATMLAFITTDAKLSNSEIDNLLQSEVRTTFNAISVDGDTSTNDSVFLLANGESGLSGDSEAFREALQRVMKHLALQIVSDGEGAKKLVSFHITGAGSDSDAEKVAKKLGDSLLVKTALFGEDPNWGRIASTVGTAGVDCSEEKLSIAYEDVIVYDKGENLFSDEVENRAYQVMKKDRFTINCDLGIGTGEFKSYACDLGYEYVKINADYRT